MKDDHQSYGTPGAPLRARGEVVHRGVTYGVRLLDGGEVELLANWVTVGRGRVSVALTSPAELGGDPDTSTSIFRSLESELLLLLLRR